MKRSTDRILTTHIGSLPRPDDMLGMLAAQEAGRGFDPAAYATRARAAVTDIVRRQVDLGIDVVDDGEQGKHSFLTYVNERLAGFEPGGAKGSPWKESREAAAFPEFYEAMGRAGGGPGKYKQMICTGPISYRGQEQLQADLDNLTAALQGVAAVEAFVPAISPANVEGWQKNAYYKSAEEYLDAIAAAMHVEYKAIVDAGFILQIDDPALATYYAMTKSASVADCRRWAQLRVEALNRALRGIPSDRIRYHTCYSINMGPRVTDMEFKDFIDIVLRVEADAYSFEAANPRHEHEWRLWESVNLPAGKSIIPGVISHTTVLVEHPELIAERLMRYAGVVGRDNVIAGADCGFATFATSNEMHPTIVWAKLGALVEGARIASQRLWSRT
jgi:5-methyltetrahydropteroyltriglutamate--homocysteine methyltransferase